MDRASRPLREAAMKWAQGRGGSGWHKQQREWRLVSGDCLVKINEAGTEAEVIQRAGSGHWAGVTINAGRATTPRGLRRILDRIA